jgi:ribosomal protein S27AE
MPVLAASLRERGLIRIMSGTKKKVGKAEWIKQKIYTFGEELEGCSVVCPNCGKKEVRAVRGSSFEAFGIVNRDNRFCTGCGTEFSNYDELIEQIEYYVKYEKKCEGCGTTINRESDKYCGKCGRKVRSSLRLRRL